MLSEAAKYINCHESLDICFFNKCGVGVYTQVYALFVKTGLYMCQNQCVMHCQTRCAANLLMGRTATMFKR